MKTATIQEIKQELLALPHSELAELTLRLARSKKENKELLTSCFLKRMILLVISKA
jgi:hypothetical protein